jgi:L-asparaginase
LPARDFQDLWKRHVAPEFGDAKVNWQWLEPGLDSSEMSPSDWGTLAGLVLKAHDDDAILLLHGTDTMAWTAAALAYLLTQYDQVGRPVSRFGKSVVLTGAQRPLFEMGQIREQTDALDNLRTGHMHCQRKIAGISVAFGGQILPAARVMKMSTSDDRAFTCPKGPAECAALPAADHENLSKQLGNLTPHLGKRAILSITPNPSDANLMCDQVRGGINSLGENLGAIFLNGFGIGNFPAQNLLAPVLRAAHERGALLISGSQVPYGDVDPSLYGAGHWLAECGALETADMSTPAAHAKLHIAMALGAANEWNQADMERFFLTPVAGELRR